MSEMGRALCGKTVKALWLDDGESCLGFELERDAANCSESCAVWETEGDCCSESWFSDIVNPQALFGAVVLAVECIEMEQIGYSVEDGRCRQEVDTAYGYKITTNKGWCDIVFRNSSNGYYGGWASESVCDASIFAGWQRVLDDWGVGSNAESVGSWRSAIESRKIGQCAKKPAAKKRAKKGI